MPKTDLPEIKKGDDFAMRSQTPQEKQNWKDADVPEYKIELNLSNEKIDVLKTQVFDEFDALKDERTDLGLEEKWSALERQYEGRMQRIPGVDFNIDVRESKVKADTIARTAFDAFMPDDGDIIDIKPRPDTARNDGYEIAARQQEFLDYAMDEEIQPHIALRKAILSSVKKFVGVTKLVWSLKMQNRRREETWKGTEEGLSNFVAMYPDAPKMYPQYIKRLARGEDVSIVVNYRDQVKNNPELKYIPIEDFYVRNACDYNAGLTLEHMIAERRRFSYYEMKEMETAGEFQNVDNVLTRGEDGEIVDGAKNEEYSVIEFTTYFRLDAADEQETKIKCWFSEEKQVFLGAIQYPYYGIDCDYIGWWAAVNDKGFYGNAESIMLDVRDTHIAQDALISLTIDGVYKRNTVTPIVEAGSEAEALFLDQQFQTGKPIAVNDQYGKGVMSGIGFLQYPNMDINGALSMAEKAKRVGDDVTRVSGLVTGGESQLDPSAPATKTVALLQQSGQGIRDYIRMLKPSFDLFASMLLQLYYQMCTEDRAYRIRSKSSSVTGDDVFKNISREDMAIRTVVQSRSAAFAFDKIQDAQRAMAAYQVVTQSPYLAQQPEVIYAALREVIGSMGGKWKTFADTMLSPSEFKDKQEAVAVKVVGAIMQKMMSGEIQGGAQELMQAAPGAITAGQSSAYNPAIGQQIQQQQGGQA